MSKKRLFIAIPLPDDIRKDLARAVDKLQAAGADGVRFLDPAGWHLTLVFLGDQGDEEINRINGALAETAAAFPAPEIRLEKIVYGPVGRTPRMIWLTTDRATSRALAEIKSDLEKRLFEAGIRFEQEHRQFTGHLTLARFSAASRGALPVLDIPFARQYTAPGADLMESHLKRSGSEYGILGSFDFEGEER